MQILTVKAPGSTVLSQDAMANTLNQAFGLCAQPDSRRFSAAICHLWCLYFLSWFYVSLNPSP